ncbi:type II toxin-antitoxin system RelB/DinJ family antitoxin [Enterococcus asini]|uniref:type II toxin-antitoxin system RelB/DinJ family antitoxin n=1 Tax=Enterococcus asini TaxID=57732 RepID=UPI001E3ECCDA|nr:type II toxin-antitoxin system RelB/DinJ family antitoxin [Enterococcus asini]MCD5029770.1 type II toxin-antitoxin system RelB/DinJ family antitoxin [Enterococcus asini]MDT2763732.1 type II toxin-antitoxin system RelB/DinJ family antitoxin [Enterococcus asini]MDT2784836.1 type II toxin-antitoxin system RelB/DinJ family antitoxin [Enterococcus asini]
MGKTKLNISIDEELKEQTKEVLDEIGMDYATAVSVYFTQIVRKKKIPFELSAEKRYRPEELFGEDWRKKVAELEDEWE